MITSKAHLQSIVTAKIPDAFVAKKSKVTKTIPTGIPELDSLIQGFPQGALTEAFGPASSGRTTMALTFMAGMTRRQQACAVIDASDTLDPESLAAARTDLNRVLWVRCGASSLPSCGLPTEAVPFISRQRSPSKPLASSCHHPRNEVRGMSQAISDLIVKVPADRSILFVKEKIETHARRSNPSITTSCSTYKNMPGIAKKREFHEEQIPPDRRPSRRGDYVLERFRERSTRGKSQTDLRHAASPVPHFSAWTRLEQALKTTDLILHNGGFGAVIMDLGDVAQTNTRRIPLATWFRFRRAVENTPTVFLLLTQESCIQTCASLVLRCECRKQRWGQAVEDPYSQNTTLDGLDLGITIVRHREWVQKFEDSTLWQSRMCWETATRTSIPD